MIHHVVMIMVAMFVSNELRFYLNFTDISVYCLHDILYHDQEPDVFH